MNNENLIHICFCINDAYVKHCLSTIISIIENCDKKYKLSINILTDYITEENKNIIKNIIEKNGSFLNIINIDKNKYNNIDLWKYWKYILYRLDCPNFIYSEKIIYLDSDIIVLWDISEIWNINIWKNIIWAIEQDKPKEFPLNINYFNSWVLLINKEKWLKFKVLEKVIELLTNNWHYWWPDQDALNQVLNWKWYKINKEWNCLDFHNKALKPKLFHFAWLKPWRWEGLNPYNLEYYKYLSKTWLINSKDSKLYKWNKIIKIIPLSFKIFIDKVIYLSLYKFKELIKSKYKKNN